MTTERKDDTEIEVTPEMVAAGVDVLEFFGPTYPSDELVKLVYRAMTEAGASHTLF